MIRFLRLIPLLAMPSLVLANFTGGIDLDSGSATEETVEETTGPEDLIEKTDDCHCTCAFLIRNAQGKLMRRSYDLDVKRPNDGNCDDLEGQACHVPKDAASRGKLVFSGDLFE